MTHIIKARAMLGQLAAAHGIEAPPTTPCVEKLPMAGQMRCWWLRADVAG